MATTYQEHTGDGSDLVFIYPFPVLKTEDVKVALNGGLQAATKYTVSLSPAQIKFNNTSIDNTLQENTGAPKSGVKVRVFRNTDEIEWIKPVHEIITGCKTYAHLPPHEELSLYHPKTIDKQIKQNELYEGLMK